MMKSNDGEAKADWVKRWLKQERIEFAPLEASYFNDGKQQLYVRASADKLDRLEQLIIRAESAK
jgi:hypothetical protein